MSLDYDLRDMKDREVHFPPNTEHTEIVGSLNLKVSAMIWATIATGIGDIKDETDADEFYVRYVYWHRLFGNGEVPFTRQDVRRAVGLKTNVYPRQTRSEWLNRLFDRFDTDLLYSEKVNT